MLAQQSLLIALGDPALRRLLASSLAATLPEFRLSFVADVAQATALLEAEPVDLLLAGLDPASPAAFTALEELAQRAPWVPLAVMTSSHDPALEPRLGALGAVLRLPEPPALDALPALLRAAAAHGLPGQLAGVSVFSVLVMLELERRSARVALRSRTLAGFFDVRDGELWHAPGGLGFVREALTVEAPQLTLGALPHSPAPRTLHAAIHTLLREASSRASALAAARRWGAQHATPDEGAVEHLRALVEQRASGELVASDARCELHVHLAQGRLLWATNSVARETLVELLVARGADGAELTSVLQECRRARLSPLETLLEWNVVQLSQLESALREQLRSALRELATLRRRECLFLRRETAPRSLSFDALALLDGLGREGAASLPPAPLSTNVAALDAMPRALQALALLQESNARLGYLELDGPDGIEPAGEPLPQPWLSRLEALRTESHRHGAHLAVVRRSDGVVLGCRVFDEASLWTFVSPADFSVTLLRMTRFGPSPARAPAPPAPDAPLRAGLGCTELETASLLAALDPLGNLPQCAWLTNAEGAPLVGVEREPSSEAALLPIAQSFNALLPRRDGEAPLAPSAKDPPQGLALLDAGRWWFAAWLDARSVLWLGYSPSAPQGVGWMHLHQVRRKLLAGGS